MNDHDVGASNQQTVREHGKPKQREPARAVLASFALRSAVMAAA
jgi:hypothetical protein